MPFNFPSNPQIGATSTQNGRDYTYAGNNVWQLVAASGGSGLSWSSVPASATATGTAGQIAYDGSYFYAATAANTWKRTPLVAWDPLYANTSLLLHLDGADGGSIVPDSSQYAHTVSISGSALRLRTGVKKFGTASFGGTTDGSNGSVSEYASVADHPSLDLGSSDFILECWAYWNSTNVTNYSPTFCAKRGASTNLSYQWAYFNNNVYFNFSTDGTSAPSVQFSWTPSTGQWYHLAISRSGSSLRFFVDGVQTGSTQSISGTAFDGTEPLRILGDGWNSNKFDGYIDDFRVVKGASYSANFTPPSSAFLNQ